MRLNISVIFDELTAFSPQFYDKIARDAPIKYIKLAESGETAFSEDTLYITDSSCLIKKFIHLSRINFLFITSEEMVYAATGQNNVIAVNCAEKPYKMWNFLTERFYDYEDWNNRLLVSLISQSSLQPSLDIASEKLTNPIALFDAALMLKCWSGKFTGSYQNTLWEDVLDRGYAPLDFYSAEDRDKLDSLAKGYNYPYLFKPKGHSNHANLVAHIFVDSKLYGALGMIDINRPFTDGQVALVSHIRDMLSLRLETSKEFLPVSENQLYYIERLLNGFSVETKSVSYHLSLRNWFINDAYNVLSFSYPPDLDNFSISTSYLRIINRYLGKALLCPFENLIIAIVRKSDYNIADDDFQKRMTDFLKKHNLKCAYSVEFSNLMDLKYYYLQCKYALEEGASHNPERALYSYIDYYKFHITSLLNTVSSPKVLCDPVIVSLWKSGKSNDKELVTCLWFFLLNGRNITATARALNVHRNTLIYRLEKLSNLLQVDFGKLDAQNMLYLLMSCILVESI